VLNIEALCRAPFGANQLVLALWKRLGTAEVPYEWCIVQGGRRHGRHNNDRRTVACFSKSQQHRVLVAAWSMPRPQSAQHPSVVWNPQFESVSPSWMPARRNMFTREVRYLGTQSEGDFRVPLLSASHWCPSGERAAARRETWCGQPLRQAALSTMKRSANMSTISRSLLLIVMRCCSF
jgi:hypothetical protein